MKDYGNAGALCGALGCMVLLIVSMHFANREEKPETDKAGAEIALNDGGEALEGTTASTGVTTTITTGIVNIGGSDADTGAASDVSGTDVPGEMSQPASTTATYAFVGPYSKEALATMTTTVSVDTAVLHEIYPDQISIVGDSIASGFGAYEVLTNPYDFATGNLASWSINDYQFEYDGTSGVYKDVLAASQPGYIYISMGMNDVNMVTSDQYAENYRQIITDVQAACPDSNIIVAGITPVSAGSSFAANTTIEKFNEKLQGVVNEFGSANIRYFDAYSILNDPATGGLASANDGGDGIHLSYAAYYSVLENLCLFLDEMPVPAAIMDEVEQVSAAQTETVSEDAAGESTDEEAAAESTDPSIA